MTISDRLEYKDSVRARVQDNSTRGLSGEFPGKTCYPGLAGDFHSLGALGPELELRTSREPRSCGSIEPVTPRPEDA